MFLEFIRLRHLEFIRLRHLEFIRRLRFPTPVRGADPGLSPSTRARNRVVDARGSPDLYAFRETSPRPKTTSRAIVGELWGVEERERRQKKNRQKRSWPTPRISRVLSSQRSTRRKPTRNKERSTAVHNTVAFFSSRARSPQCGAEASRGFGRKRNSSEITRVSRSSDDGSCASFACAWSRSRS